MMKEENVMRLGKGKKGLLNMLFGRTTVILLMLLAQIGLMLLVVQAFGDYLTYAWGGGMLMAICVIVHIINRDENPTVKITWILLVAALPIFGTFMYIWTHVDIGHRILHKALEEELQQTKEYIKQDESLEERMKEREKELYDLAHYLKEYGNFTVFDDTETKYLPSGEVYFETMLEELQKAEKFIFMEYFIIEEGYMWGRILDTLHKKVKEGVEVRVMYDGTCAIGKLPYGYPKKMSKLGIKCKMFAPPKPFVSTHYNNRDHRKILVIDGKVGFTGGVNLADEYINKRTLFGHWKDTGLMLKGEGVRTLTLMFMQMWNMNESRKDYEKYLYSSAVQKMQDVGYVIPYGDSPMDDEHVGEMIYMDIINKATSYVHIMTPYLILDGEMLTALCFAAKRGIDVKIILPYIPDKEYAFALAKTHYKQLITSGVEVYEYRPGFVHAKSFVSDDKKAVVGTINLDYRSLYHHFENGVYMYKTPAVLDVEDDFNETLKKCVKINLGILKNEKLSRKIMGRIFKILAPLM